MRRRSPERAAGARLAARRAFLHPGGAARARRGRAGVADAVQPLGAQLRRRNLLHPAPRPRAVDRHRGRRGDARPRASRGALPARRRRGAGADGLRRRHAARGIPQLRRAPGARPRARGAARARRRAHHDAGSERGGWRRIVARAAGRRVLQAPGRRQARRLDRRTAQLDMALNLLSRQTTAELPALANYYWRMVVTSSCFIAFAACGLLFSVLLFPLLCVVSAERRRVPVRWLIHKFFSLILAVLRSTGCKAPGPCWCSPITRPTSTWWCCSRCFPRRTAW